jgi:hypothetical protein
MLSDLVLKYFPYEEPKGFNHNPYLTNETDFPEKIGHPVFIYEDCKKDLLVDLQTATDCYCADLIKINNKKFVYLFGSGWKDCGFPYYQSVKEDDQRSGHYLLLSGKACEIFCELINDDRISKFHDCFPDENYKDLHDFMYIPLKNYKTEVVDLYQCKEMILNVSYMINIDDYMNQAKIDYLKKLNLDEEQFNKLDVKEKTKHFKKLTKIIIAAEKEAEEKNISSRKANYELMKKIPAKEKINFTQLVTNTLTGHGNFIWNIATYFGFFESYKEYEQYLYKEDYSKEL